MNDCDCMSILTIYSTSMWHKLNQEKKRIIQYNYTLSSHHVYLSFITHFFAQWMTIIEQENAVLRYNHKHYECKETSFIFKSRIKSKHHCIKYRQWRAEQRRCVTTNSTDICKSLLKHHALNRSYRFIIDNTMSVLLFQWREVIV